MTHKVAIVTGAPGQDASYLCEFLLDKDYEVYGIERRSMRENDHMNECEAQEKYHRTVMDICDASGIRNLVRDVQPDEFYNLAAMSHVGQSFKEPLASMQVNAVAVMGILEAIRHEKPDCRFYQASTSEMFGKEGYINSQRQLWQDEETPLVPRSPYAVGKVAAHNSVNLYREAYGLHASCGILFNHESPRRGKDFVTRKVTDACARIRMMDAGKTIKVPDYIVDGKIKMGNLEAYRDFGHAKDYVRAMWMMLQQDTPDDYVICSHNAVSIREMLEYVANKIGRTVEEIYEPDEQFMRPSDVPYLCGDNSKAVAQLGWEPEYTWQSMLDEMFDSDWNAVIHENFSPQPPVPMHAFVRHADGALTELLPK